MKICSSFRRNTILCMVGTTLIGCGLFTLEALALPAEQILQKLDPVPVFTIADEQGAPLVREIENEGKIAGVFISQDDAIKVVEEIKKQNPGLAEKVNVVPVSLGEIYKLSETAESQDNALSFIYQPEEEAVTSAKAIGEANQQPYQGGVPLFVAKVGDDGDYLTIEKDSQRVIPFFFDKKQLEDLVSKFKEQKPEVSASVDIEVVPLEGVIETLKTSEYKMLEKIVLVPTAESIEFLQGAAAREGEGAAPAPAGMSPIEAARETLEETKKNGEAMREAMKETAEYGSLGTPAGFPLPIVP